MLTKAKISNSRKHFFICLMNCMRSPVNISWEKSESWTSTFYFYLLATLTVPNIAKYLMKVHQLLHLCQTNPLGLCNYDNILKNILLFTC